MASRCCNNPSTNHDITSSTVAVSEARAAADTGCIFASHCSNSSSANHDIATIIFIASTDASCRSVAASFKRTVPFDGQRLALRDIYTGIMARKALHGVSTFQNYLAVTLTGDASPSVSLVSYRNDNRANERHRGSVSN